MKRVNFRVIFLLLATLFVATSCSEEQLPDPTITIDGNSTEFAFNKDGGKNSFVVRTNFEHWELVSLGEQSEWLDVWPVEGDYDGRFTVTAPENDKASPREAVILLVARGVEQARFTISQVGQEPYVTLNMASADIRVPYLGSEALPIAIESNVAWECVIPEGVDWITLGEKSDDIQQLIVSRNEDTERTAKLEFRMVGTGNEDISTSINVSQLDISSDPTAAVLTPIAEILATLGVAGGVVDDNIKIMAEVTADYSGNNITRDELFVQDASGRGIQFELSDVALNTFNVGDKLTIHMVGLELVVDADGARFVGLSSASILDNENSTPLNVEPLSVATIAEIDATMAGTLISLPQVEYAVPYGSYCNFDEGYYGRTMFSFTPHILQDSNGDTIPMRVEFGDDVAAGAVFKYGRYLPKGSGEFVGLVQFDAEGIFLKMRTLSDDKITDSNRMWNLTTEFYWPDRSILNFSGVIPYNLDAAVGTGTLFLHGPSTHKYNVGYSYVRTDLSVLSDADAKGEDGPVTSYQAINTTGTGWSTNYTGSNGNTSTGWIITTSTKGASRVLFSISTSSSATGPGEFILLYSTDGGATIKEAGIYDAMPWNNSLGYIAGTLGSQVVLPDDAADADALMIKLTPRSKARADFTSTSTIGSSGTNRVGYISIQTK